MRQNLNMRQGQSLVMTPQLQQAIKLLQLSNQELAEFVDAEIERNPLLTKAETDQAADTGARGSDEKDMGARAELGDGGAREIGAASEALDAPSEDVNNGDSGADAGGAPSQSGPSAATDWSKAGSGKGGGGEGFDFEARLSSEKSLREHLSEQVMMAGFGPGEALIAARLVDDTDEGGYCRADLQEVADALGAELAPVSYTHLTLPTIYSV